MQNLTPEFLGIASGALLSVAFSYIPGARDWFDKLTGVQKRLTLFSALLVVSVVIFALGCMRGAFELTCDGNGAWRVVYILTAAIIANQTAYTIEGK